MVAFCVELFLFCDKLLDCTGAGVELTVCDKGGRLMDAQLCSKLRSVLCQNLFVEDAGIVQHLDGDTAVGAGGGGKEQGLFAVNAALFFGLCFLFCGVGSGAVTQVILFALLIFLRLTHVPVLHGAVVAGNAAIDLRGLTAVGAGEMLAFQVAVALTDGVGGGQGVVGQAVVFCNLAHQRGGRLPRGQLLAQEGVEDGAGGVEGLQVILNIQRGKNVVGETDR